jgi:hypothetical protein
VLREVARRAVEGRHAMLGRARQVVPRRRTL